MFCLLWPWLCPFVIGTGFKRGPRSNSCVISKCTVYTLYSYPRARHVFLDVEKYNGTRDEHVTLETRTIRKWNWNCTGDVQHARSPWGSRKTLNSIPLPRWRSNGMYCIFVLWSNRAPPTLTHPVSFMQARALNNNYRSSARATRWSFQTLGFAKRTA
jgi:hypothetical protein